MIESREEMLTRVTMDHVDQTLREERRCRARKKSLQWLDQRDDAMDDLETDDNMDTFENRNELRRDLILIREGLNPPDSRTWSLSKHLLRKRSRGGKSKIQG